MCRRLCWDEPSTTNHDWATRPACKANLDSILPADPDHVCTTEVIRKEGTRFLTNRRAGLLPCAEIAPAPHAAVDTARAGELSKPLIR